MDGKGGLLNDVLMLINNNRGKGLMDVGWDAGVARFQSARAQAAGSGVVGALNPKP